MLSANEIRSSFIEFFKERSHKFVPSSPVVPIDDETLLFANAGMNQFKEIFLGLSSRDYTRAANSQKCIRAGGKHNDLEDVGTDTYHHTFFEMLGNWSFGDYFKTEAIDWAWELLTKVWKMDPERLHATYFQGDKADGLEPDNDARDLWLKYLPAERIHPGNKKDNFWEMGETGPCGPCSELHYDSTPDKSGAALVNADDARVIEIWNLVFIQYNRDGEGKLSPLPAKHVDTGMGLERVAVVLQGKNSNYDTDLFTPIIQAISKLTGKGYTYDLHLQSDIAFRVIADHIRTLVFAITDGGSPSNEGRGYVVRRILRRAARFGRVLDMHEPFIYKLVDVVVDEMGDAFAQIKERGEFVKTVIESEEAGFGRTLDRGIEIFSAAAERAEKSAKKTIHGEDAFQLYDTYGFPLDLTQLMARERNLTVDTKTFEELMEQQRQRGRAAQKADSLAVSLSGVSLPETDDLAKYEMHNCEAKVIGWIENDSFVTEGELAVETGPAAVVLDRTCFYAEAGGQIGDCGIIESAQGKFVVETTEKIAGCVIHRGKITEGKILSDSNVMAVVDSSRESSRKNHTATHLLQWALREVLGPEVKQQGSLVCPDYLRFDFTYPKAMSAEQVKKTEDLVAEKIEQALPVTSVVMAIDEARKLGATALFNEKYGDEVRVVAIGAETGNNIASAFSREFCGGTHTHSTGPIGGIKIIKEESISAGVRRITALTGTKLGKYLKQRSDIVDELCLTLKVVDEQLVERIAKVLDDNKKLAKQLKAAAKKGGTDVTARAAEMLKTSEKIGGTSIVTGKLEPAPVEQVRAAIDMIKKKAKSAAIVFGMADGDKVILMAAATDDLVKKGVKAGDIVKEIAPIVGGGGGGQPQFAQAGGKDPAKLDKALQKAAKLIKAKL